MGRTSPASWLWSLQGKTDLFSLQSHSRGMALSAHMQEALEAKEQEVQRLAEGQREVSTGLLGSPDLRQPFHCSQLDRSPEATGSQELPGVLAARAGLSCQCPGNTAMGQIRAHKEPSGAREVSLELTLASGFQCPRKGAACLHSIPQASRVK